MKRLLQLENILLLSFTLFIYFYFFNFSWQLLLLLLLVPDISMIGYIINTKIGATIYNSCHHLLIPILLCGLGILFHNNLLIMISLIWFTHIFMDRTLGFGLKYPTSFQKNHLN